MAKVFFWGGRRGDHLTGEVTSEDERERLEGMEEIATKGMYYRKDWLGRDSDHHTGEMTSEYGERLWERRLPTRACTIRPG